jgi:hypothetical protein
MQYDGFLEILKAGSKIFSGTVVKLRREGFGIEFDSEERVFYRG